MSQDIKIGGIVFRVYTAKENNKYYGKWVCLKCAKTGESSQMCGSEEEALKCAVGNAGVHAGAGHRKDKEA